MTSTATKASASPQGSTSTRDRAFRGLALSLLLSFVNFLGLIVTAVSIGAVKGWTVWEFATLVACFEAAVGLASLYLPNVWHLPVAELETSDRTRVQLAVSSLLLPHWGGIARFCVGIGVIIAAGYTQGVGASAVLIAPFILLFAAFVLALSMLVARLGVAYPDIDVVQLIVRWRGQTKELTPLSLSASVLQFLLGVATLPAASILKPSVLFPDGALGFSTVALVISAIATVLTTLAVFVAWSGRTRRQAPREQQKEIEANA